MEDESRRDSIDRRIENLHINIESLHSSVAELYAAVHEGRLRAEEQGRTIDKLVEAARRDGENIEALARIAEAHERRLGDLEGGE